MQKLIFVCLILALVAAAADHAHAHAMLKSASPEVGGTIATPPAQVSIDFTEDVEPRFSRIEVQDASGHRVDANDLHLVAGHASELAIGLKRLVAGVYKVIWHATSTDTHKTQGSYSFTVSGP